MVRPRSLRPAGGWYVWQRAPQLASRTEPAAGGPVGPEESADPGHGSATTVRSLQPAEPGELRGSRRRGGAVQLQRRAPERCGPAHLAGDTGPSDAAWSEAAVL